MQICKGILLFLLLAATAFGTPTLKYVDFTLGTDDAEHGGSSGTGAWKTLAYAETQVGDITGVTDGWKIICSNGVDTTGVTISGSPVTDADSPLWIYGDGTYSLSISNADALLILEDYVIVDNIQFVKATGNADNQRGIVIYGQNANNLIQIKNCTVVGHGNGSYYETGILVNDADTIVQIWNTLVYNIGAKDNANSCPLRMDACTTAAISNCTFSGGKYGVYAIAGTFVCSNVVALNTLTADFYDAGAGATTTQIHCCSEDASGDDWDTHAVGNIVNQTLSAFSATYRLQAGNPCINAGTDLSGGTPAVTTDIDGTARDATYDIGCDEYTGTPLLLRRRHL